MSKQLNDILSHLDCLENETELVVFRILYKGKSQHRRTIYFHKLKQFSKTYKKFSALGIESIIRELLGIPPNPNSFNNNNNNNINIQQKSIIIQKRNISELLSQLYQSLRFLIESIDAVVISGKAFTDLLAQNFFMPLALTMVSALSRVFVLIWSLSVLLSNIYDSNIKRIQNVGNFSLPSNSNFVREYLSSYRMDTFLPYLDSATEELASIGSLSVNISKETNIPTTNNENNEDLVESSVNLLKQTLQKQTSQQPLLKKPQPKQTNAPVSRVSMLLSAASSIQQHQDQKQQQKELKKQQEMKIEEKVEEEIPTKTETTISTPISKPTNTQDIFAALFGGKSTPVRSNNTQQQQQTTKPTNSNVTTTGNKTMTTPTRPISQAATPKVLATTPQPQKRTLDSQSPSAIDNSQKKQKIK